eukprot:scaffold27277_cov149-Skeletonema_dohrnii-CCMP3373.AAC.1
MTWMSSIEVDLTTMMMQKAYIQTQRLTQILRLTHGKTLTIGRNFQTETTSMEKGRLAAYFSCALTSASELYHFGEGPSHSTAITSTAL